MTGVPGLPARTVARSNDTIYSPGTTWHNSSTQPGWVWKGDTSSDETTGHVFGMAALLASGALDAARAKRTAGLVRALVGGIVANNLTLVDVTVRPALVCPLPYDTCA